MKVYTFVKLTAAVDAIVKLQAGGAKFVEIKKDFKGLYVIEVE